MNNFIYLVPACGLIGLLFIYIKAQWVIRQDEGDPKMKEIAGYIADGAMSFLKAEYKVLLYYVVIAGGLLFALAQFGGGDDASGHGGGGAHGVSTPWIVLSFVIGAFFSALAGFLGMRIATKANVRTAQAARTSLSKALDISFGGGTVMGIGVVSIAILGLSGLFIAFSLCYGGDEDKLTGKDMGTILGILTGFSLGAESIALFARVGGGIYTKAADVGADLVGKVEAGIPEDDPRNPAVIADNVGDNVGDVAGMGADLFGSYVATVVGSMVLGLGAVAMMGMDSGINYVTLPLMIAAVGILFSIAGTFFVKVKEGGNPQAALNIGNFVAVGLTAAGSFGLIHWLVPGEGEYYIFGSVLVGLAVGTLISLVTEYFTSMGKPPVTSIIRQSGTGAATNLIAGLGQGMLSTGIPILILAAGIIAASELAGLYGVAIAASGMMATTGIQLAVDAFGPIADNAGGVAEMSGLPKEVRANTDVLDAVGNTTAAIGKGFAIASAALTTVALFAAFMVSSGISVIDVANPKVMGGLFVGGMIPFVFSALAMGAVGKAAMFMVEEVRRQFREIPGLLAGDPNAKADYGRCVEIATKGAIQQMILPGALAIISPVIIGFVFGPEVLGGMLAGVTVAGVLMAIFQSNAGGAWDNAKKSFEKGVEINGKMHYKGSDPHKAAVVGDTVGDPFKDTSGPSMNILIKLMSIVSLVIAPYLTKGGWIG